MARFCFFDFVFAKQVRLSDIFQFWLGYRNRIIIFLYWWHLDVLVLTPNFSPATFLAFLRITFWSLESI